MCGLITVAGNIFSTDILKFEQLTTVTYLRGTDATGVAAVYKNETKIIKKPTSPKYFFGSFRKELDKAISHDALVLMGHARAATVGGYGEDAAHPFAFKQVIGMHNGHIDKDILRDLPERYNAPTDSEEVIRNIGAHGYAKTLEHMRGHYAFVWFDRTTSRLYFIRNDKRPLSYALSSDGQTIWLHSEVGALKWILERESQKTYNYQEVKVGKLYSCYVTNKGVSDFKIEEITTGKFKSTVVHTNHWTPSPEASSQLKKKLTSGTSCGTTTGYSPKTQPTKPPLTGPARFDVIEDVPILLPEELRDFGITQLRDYKDRINVAIATVNKKLANVQHVATMNWADKVTWRKHHKANASRVLSQMDLVVRQTAALYRLKSQVQARIESYERIKQVHLNLNKEMAAPVAPAPNENLREFSTLANKFTNEGQLFDFFRKHKGCACCSDDNPRNFLVANSLLLKADAGFICSTCAESEAVTEEFLDHIVRIGNAA